MNMDEIKNEDFYSDGSLWSRVRERMYNFIHVFVKVFFNYLCGQNILLFYKPKDIFFPLIKCTTIQSLKFNATKL